jgi:hypothetical protein
MGGQGDNHQNKDQGKGRQQHGERHFIRRFLALGAFHQPDHAVNETVAGIGGDLEVDFSCQQFGPANHTAMIAAGFTQHRGRFAGDSRLVDGGHAPHNFAIGGDVLTLADPHPITFAELVGIDRLFTAILKTTGFERAFGRAQTGGLSPTPVLLQLTRQSWQTKR